MCRLQAYVRPALGGPSVASEHLVKHLIQQAVVSAAVVRLRFNHA